MGSDTAGAVLDILLGAAVLAGSCVALYAPRRVTGVMGFLLLGLVLTLVWARLGAPDIALAEAALASGVTGAFLMAAMTEHPGSAEPLGSRRLRRVVAGESLLALGGVVLFGVAAVQAVRALPDRTLQVLATDDAPEAAVDHPITAVLLDLRAYDTLLEVTVLMVAVVAAVALARDGGLRDRVHVVDERPFVRGVVVLVVPIVLLASGWLLVAGSTMPGGAFQAGALLTGAYLLWYLSSHGRRWEARPWLVTTAAAGVAAFLVLAVVTRLLGRGWLDVPAGGGLAVLAVETMITVGIGAGLAAIFVAGMPAAPRTEEARDQG